ncbi:MAG: STAS/SEC14 domain-containing protein [Cyclobacteriaceae bacterium]
MYLITYDESDDIIFVELKGESDFEDLKQHLKNLRSRFKHHDNLFILADQTSGKVEVNMLTIAIDVYELKSDVQALSADHAKIFSAQVVKNANDKGILHLHQSLNENLSNYQVKLFESKQEARAWLKENQ